MYPHTPSSTTADLHALRTRLYRPDPPEDAVEAYLAALHAGEPSPVPEGRPAADRPRGVLRGVAALGAMTVLAVGLGAAVSLGHQTSASGATGAGSLALPPVPGRPIGTLLGPGGTTGLFDAAGSRVVVGVRCSGDGTLDLRVGDEQPITLACGSSGPALRTLPSTGSLEVFTVSVARHGAVHWSLAVGAEDLAAT